jgi:hypothetical protein
MEETLLAEFDTAVLEDGGIRAFMCRKGGYVEALFVDSPHQERSVNQRGALSNGHRGRPLRPALAAITCVVSAVLASCAATPVDTAGDRARLLALHEEAMEAHRKGDVELLLQADAEEFVLVSRGEISRPSLDQRRQFLGPYLQRVKFTEYVDVVTPVVHVSADGTAGWVIAQVKARGTEVSGAGRSVQFESAWIELYEKRGGGWRRVGNVSNFK